MSRRVLVGVGLVLLIVLVPETGRAQLFSFEAERARPVQALAAGYFLNDFTYDGDDPPAFTFNFGEPAVGLVYTRPRFFVTAGIGGQEAGTQPGEVVAADTVDLRLVDLSLSTWAEIQVLPDWTGRTRLIVPIVLHTNYRRVAPQGDNTLLETFDVTVLGLGTGLGLSRSLGGSLIEARAHPILGLATTSLGDALGSARLLDAQVQWHSPPLFGRFGLSLGYAYRTQVWNVDASDLFEELTGDLFDYRGQMHLLWAGVNW